MEYPEGIRGDVLNADDICKTVPALANHRKTVERVMHWIGLDEVNAIHSRWAYDTGAAFARHLVDDEFKFTLRVDNEEEPKNTEPALTMRSLISM